MMNEHLTHHLVDHDAARAKLLVTFREKMRYAAMLNKEIKKFSDPAHARYLTYWVGDYRDYARRVMIELLEYDEEEKQARQDFADSYEGEVLST